MQQWRTTAALSFYSVCQKVGELQRIRPVSYALVFPGLKSWAKIEVLGGLYPGLVLGLLLIL